MKKLLIGLVVLLSASLITIVSCSDKNSIEACLHETSMNLDRGNFDAVLASPCADAMQKGAAYFGKAGFTVTSVINSFIDAGATNSGSSQSDLNRYMTALVKTVSGASLDNLDKAKASYALVAAGTENFKSAQFNISIVLALKSLSLIKTVIPGDLVSPDGTLNKSCDQNNDGVPDSADATACALIASNNINQSLSTPCSGGTVTYSRSNPLDITLTIPATGQTISAVYSGLAITVSGFNTPACTTNSYQRLLYKDSSNKYWAATTTADLCNGSDGKQWPCPITGANQDLVTSIDNSINGSLSALNSALTSSNTDVQNAINDIKSQACKSPCNGVCPGASCPQSCVSPYTGTYCSSDDLSKYITTYLK